MDSLGKRADISLPFILGMILLIMVFVLLIYFAYSGYLPAVEDLTSKIWGGL